MSDTLERFRNVERYEPGYDDDLEMVTIDTYSDGNWMRHADFNALLAVAEERQKEIERLEKSVTIWKDAEEAWFSLAKHYMLRLKAAEAKLLGGGMRVTLDNRGGK